MTAIVMILDERLKRIIFGKCAFRIETIFATTVGNDSKGAACNRWTELNNCPKAATLKERLRPNNAAC